MLLRQRAILGSTSVVKLEINAPRSVSKAFLGAKEDPLKTFIGSFTDDSAVASAVKHPVCAVNNEKTRLNPKSFLTVLLDGI